METQNNTYSVIDFDVVLFDNLSLEDAKYYTIEKSKERESGDVYVSDANGETVFTPTFSIMEDGDIEIETGLSYTRAISNSKHYNGDIDVVAEQGW